MADQTSIEWTDATWNIVTGCSVVSPGCTNCYAMRLAGTRLQHHPSRAGLTTDSKAGPVWNGQVRFNAEWLTQPLRWTKPRRIFVAAHGDLFHDGVTDDQLDQIFAVMALCPQHTFQILTKRPERMRSYVNSGYSEVIHSDVRGHEVWRQAYRLNRAANPSSDAPFTEALRAQGCSQDTSSPWPLPNVWLGVSVEDQARADERIPALLDTPAAVRWISAEPLLGPVMFDEIPSSPGATTRKLFGPLSGYCQRHFPRTDCRCERQQPHIDWVVAGGESGPGARPMHPDWARQLRDQCAAAGAPFLFKQWGDWGPVTVEGDPEWDTIDEGIDPATAKVLNPRETCLLHIDGRREDDQGMAWPDAEPRQMLRLGKKETGRRLDGVLHDGFPEARP